MTIISIKLLPDQSELRAEEIMSRKTPDQIAAKYARNASAAQGDWKDGVDAVTDNPMAKAAASDATWQARVSSQQAREKFKRNVGRVPMEEWKARTGAATGRYSQGVQAGQGKMAKYAAEVAPHMEALQRKIAAMPNVTLEDKIARSAEWQRGMAAYKRPA